MRRQIGTETLPTAAVIGMLMLLGTLFLFPEIRLEGSYGIAFPSPNLWPGSVPSSWIMNSVMVLAVAPIMIFCNKKYNFVQGGGMALPSSFIILICGNPFLTRYFCASTLLLIVNCFALWILFDTYKKRNATPDFFVIATLISLGSMVQYAFLPMTIVYLGGGFIMKSLKIKEFLAFLLGLIAPYWVGIGFGIIPLSSLQMPEWVNIFSYLGHDFDLAVMLISTGILFLCAAILSLNNAVRLYAGNTKIRCLNNAVNLLGYVSALCMVVDFNNTTTYLGVLYLWIAVQTGNLFALHKIHRPHIVFWILLLLYSVQYILIIR